MTAMIDASCPKCGRRFGWCGTMANRPACPRCGHRPPQEELEAAEAEMKAMEEQLLTHPRDAGGAMLRKQRVGAGLTLHQASGLLGLSAVELSRIERGLVRPSEELAAKMADVYGTGQE